MQATMMLKISKNSSYMCVASDHVVGHIICLRRVQSRHAVWYWLPQMILSFLKAVSFASNSCDLFLQFSIQTMRTPNTAKLRSSITQRNKSTFLTFCKACQESKANNKCSIKILHHSQIETDMCTLWQFYNTCALGVSCAAWHQGVPVTAVYKPRI
jgi:hypothetical protein